MLDEAVEEMPGALCQETSKRPRDGISDDWAMNYRLRASALVSCVEWICFAILDRMPSTKTYVLGNISFVECNDLGAFMLWVWIDAIKLIVILSKMLVLIPFTKT